MKTAVLGYMFILLSFTSYSQLRVNTYEYDYKNQLIETNFYNNISYSYTYDALGNRKSKIVSDFSTVQPSALLTDIGNGLIQLDWFVNSNNSDLSITVIGGCVFTTGYQTTVNSGGGSDTYQLIGEGTVQVIFTITDANGQTADDVLFIQLGSLMSPNLFINPSTAFIQNEIFNIILEYDNGDYGSLELQALFVESDGDTTQAIPFYSFDSTLTDGNYQMNFSTLLSSMSTEVEYLIIEGSSSLSECNSSVVYSNAYYLDDINTSVLNILNEKISIYPNPTSGFINIETSFEEKIKILIEDSKGSLIYSEKHNYEKQNIHSIDLSPQANGSYTITLINKKGAIVESQRIIRVK